MTPLSRTAGRIIPYFILLSMLFFSYLMHDSFQLAKGAGLCVSIIFFLVLSLFSYGLKADISLPALLLAVFYLWISACLVFSPWHPPFYYGLLFFSPLVFFPFYFCPPRSGKLVFFLNILFTVSALYAFTQSARLNISRPYSFFGNPIFFAEFSGGLLPFLALGAALPGRQRILSVFNLILAPSVFLLCSSRGAALSAVVSVLFFIYLLFRSGIKVASGRKIAAVVIAAAVCLVLLVPGLGRSFSSGLKRAQAVFSLSNSGVANRLTLARTSLKISADSPVAGSGAGAMRVLHPAKQAGILRDSPGIEFVNSSYSHDDYLQLLAETGSVGLLLFLFFVFATVHSAEVSAPALSREDFLYCSAASCSIVFYMMESFFNFPLFSMPSSALFFAFCGIIASHNPGKKFLLRNVPMAAVSALLIAPLFIYLIFLKPHAFASDFYLQRASDVGAQAGVWCQRAYDLEPDSFYAAFYLGNYYGAAYDPRDASAYYLKASKLQPYSPDMYYNLGNMSYAMKDYKAAVTYYESAVYYYPGFALAHLGLYKCLMDMKEETKGLAQLDEALKCDPNVLKGTFDRSVMFFGEVSK
jgi:O-antigen ligase